MVHDKSRTLKFAIEHGIPCPETYFVDGIDEVESLSMSIPYPVVIKPIASGRIMAVLVDDGR